MILIIDNYDSFVYNLARYVSELGFTYVVKRNNKITLQEIEELNPSHIILSPGPCTPNEAGICLEITKTIAQKIPLLGVCLGHQVIGQAYGGQIVHAKEPAHGKSSMITHDEKNIFFGLENPLKVGRYNSLAVSLKNFPSCLNITARSTDGEIMALQHNTFPLYGVQFHPESILTNQGHNLLLNFIQDFRYATPQ